MITYYAANDTMGDTTPEKCSEFRAWAKIQLEAEFPNHKIQVSEQPNLKQIITNDEENREFIEDFASRLWDRWV